MRPIGGKRLTATTVAATLAVTMFAACSPQQQQPGSADVVEPASKGLEVVKAETILAAQPAGVTPAASSDDPAVDGIVQYNSATRTFSAPSEAAASAAANDLRNGALASGYSGPPLADPGGLSPTSVLTKGFLELEISYTTAAYKQAWPEDDAGFEVSMVLTYKPTTTENPSEGG